VVPFLCRLYSFASLLLLLAFETVVVVVSLRRRNGTQGVVLMDHNCRFFSVEEALLSSIARVAEVEADVVSSSSSSLYYYS
jgi:hypothetical protein